MAEAVIGVGEKVIEKVTGKRKQRKSRRNILRKNREKLIISISLLNAFTTCVTQR